MAFASPTLPLVPVPQEHDWPRKARTPAVTAPRLSVVLVNYNQWEDTAQLVRELAASEALAHGAAEIVVVDNHSPPHPLLGRLRRRPGVSVRRWGRNRGFARAVNEGARLSRGGWLLLLNPDMSAPPGFLDKVLALAGQLETEEPKAGVVGFQLRHSDGGRQFSAGPFPSLALTLARLVLPRERRKYLLARPRRRRQVPWVTGCCQLIRRDCLRQLGGLDERFFLYYEDVDLCRRARDRGWSVWYEPALRLTHHRPLQSRRKSLYLHRLTRHALLTYAARHWPWPEFRTLAALVWAEGWLKRHGARWRGDAEAAWQFGQLRAVAGEFGRGAFAAARRRLDRWVRREERHAS